MFGKLPKHDYSKRFELLFNAHVQTEKAVMNETNADLKALTKAEDEAAKRFHEMRAELRAGGPLKSTVDKMAKLRKASRHAVDRCHASALALKSSFSTVLYPEFSVSGSMVSKNSSNALPKKQKSSAQSLRHGEHRRKVVRKLGLLGRIVVKTSEACSSMCCPFCLTIATPGMMFTLLINACIGVHRMHHCSNSRCRRIAFRDECGRAMSLINITRALGSKIDAKVKGSPCVVAGGPQE